MFTVYVLQDENKKLYKGLTNNPARRLAEHKRGKTFTTRKMKDLKIVYTEEYGLFEQARAREVYFKTAAGRKFLKNIIVGVPARMTPVGRVAQLVTRPNVPRSVRAGSASLIINNS